MEKTRIRKVKEAIEDNGVGVEELEEGKNMLVHRGEAKEDYYVVLVKSA